MQKEINELLQERIKNEKKQKSITTITAVLFCLFAMVIIGLAIHSYKQEKIIDAQKKELEIAKTQDSLTLNRTAVVYEQQADNKTNELNKIEETKKTTGRLGSDTLNIIKDNSKINTANSSLNKNYTIYIQYNEDLLQQSSLLKNALIEKKYTVAKQQNMKNLDFSSSVRYFYGKDKDRANEIAKKAEEIIKKNFKVQYMQLKSPKNQIEVWIGQ